MDELVDELPAGGLDVRVRRRQSITAGHVKAVDGAELAGANPPPRLAEARVEPALKADLHAAVRPLHVLDHALRRVQVERDRLLAEDRNARVEPAVDELRVSAGRRHDHHRVRPTERVVDRRGVDGAELLRQHGRPRGVGVVDPKLVDAGEFAEDLRVERAESPHAENRDLHSTRL